MFTESPAANPVTERTEAQQLRELAEAIRRGCKIRPRQCRAFLFALDTHSCALGAALIGASADVDVTNPEVDQVLHYQMIDERFPILDLLADGQFLRDQIVDWNDRNRWSRERIADRLDELAAERESA